jgi:hypothetical protein
MTSVSDVHDVGASIISNLLLQNRFALGDPEANGASFDTIPNNSQELGSALIQIDADGAIAGADATCAITLQDAADDGAGAPTAFADVAAGVFMDAADGAAGIPANPVITLTVGAPAGAFFFNVPLHRLRRHVRVQTLWVVPGAADTVDFHMSAICGGTVIKPV